MTFFPRAAIFLLAVSICSASPIQKKSSSAEVDLYTRALQAKARGEFNQAVTLLRTALSRTPNYSEARFQLGMVFFELKRWKEAEEEFRKYVQQHPDSFQAHNNLAAIYAQLGMVDSLARELKTVVKLRPDYAQGHANLADFYVTLAMRSLWRAYRISAPPEQASLKLKLEKMLAASSVGAEADFVRGQMARVQGDKPAARDFFLKASQADPEYSSTKLLEEARRLVREGELDDAMDDLNALSIVGGTSSEASLMAGDILIRQKKYEAALVQFQRVQEPQQSDMTYILGMAAALRGVGQPERSVTFLETALEKQNDPALRRQLAEAHKASGDFTKAAGEYEKLLSTESDPSWVRKEIVDLSRQKLRAAETTNGSRAARGEPAEGPGRLPDSLLVLPTGQRCVIVEKETQTLLLFRRVASGFELEKSYACSTGAKEGEKSEQGDHKTPEGIYLFKKILPGSQLSAIYGKMAITLDYPNPFDKLEGKGGDGIWLHATNETIRPYLPNKTRGCVVVSNADIEELSKLIALDQTPLIIVSKLRYWTPTETEAEAASLRNFLAQWRQHWESKALNPYIGMYSSRFQNGAQNLRAYRTYKEGVFSRAGRIQIHLDLESVVQHEKYAVLTFKQEYRSNRLSSTGTKRLFVVKENGAWKIIAEIMR